MALDVQGITDGATVQGAQRITVVAIGGQPQQVELLVDGTSQGVKTAPPFTFDWNPSSAGAGLHTLVVRATDASGPVEKQLTVQVTAPTNATAVASPSPRRRRARQRPTTNLSQFTQPLLIGGGILALLVLAAWVCTSSSSSAIGRRSEPKPAPVPVVVAEVVPAVEESTEFIGRVPLENLTMVSNRRQVAVLPKASLLVKPDREIELSRFKETVIGRDSTNAAYVDDRQVSRHHARILVVDGDFWIEDLNSTNGTRVNGTTVTKQKLANNDMINVGDTTMTFALEQP